MLADVDKLFIHKMSEKSEINGGPYQYDDYGTVDKTRIIDQDELVSLIDFFTHYIVN
jgi:hypothetical protein